MSNDSREIRNWFDQDGHVYKRFRPDYPSQLGSFLASNAPDTKMAVDVGCGNGQLTKLLANYFRRAIGVDPSIDQVANAIPHERISYRCASAEHLPIADRSANVVTAAQAAHWFNLPAFYQEVRRIVTPKGLLAMISYGVLDIESPLNDRFQQFYWEEINPYWPPGRELVETGYQTVDFPFEELTPPPMEIHLEWDLTEFLGYLSTWSSVRVAKEAGNDKMLRNFVEDISAAWGESTTRRPIKWPINMRIGCQ